MFSFTIAEFTFLCVGFAFVGSLILFPSFRQQLKALAGGFLQVFVQDTAKTPDGARATRDGLQESREKAAGAKVLYQTSREGKLDKADANTADYKVSSYLDSLKKSNPNVTTYSIPDLNALTKSSGLNTQSKK